MSKWWPWLTNLFYHRLSVQRYLRELCKTHMKKHKFHSNVTMLPSYWNCKCLQKQERKLGKDILFMCTTVMVWYNTFRSKDQRCVHSLSWSGKGTFKWLFGKVSQDEHKLSSHEVFHCPILHLKERFSVILLKYPSILWLGMICQCLAKFHLQLITRTVDNSQLKHFKYYCKIFLHLIKNQI